MIKPIPKRIVNLLNEQYEKLFLPNNSPIEEETTYTFRMAFFEKNTIFIVHKSIHYYLDASSEETIEYDGIYKYQNNTIYDELSEKTMVDANGELKDFDLNTLTTLFQFIDYIDPESIQKFGSPILEKDVAYLNQLDHFLVLSLLYSPFYYKDFTILYNEGYKNMAYNPHYKIEDNKLVIRNPKMKPKYKKFILQQDLSTEEIEVLNTYQIPDKEWLQNLKWLPIKLENYVCDRTYKDTPYEKGVPINVLENLRKEVIEPFLETLDFKAIYQYFKKKKLEASKLILYIEYRYLRFYYFDYLKELYENSKKFPYLFLKCNPLYHETPKNLYITYQEYPKNFIHVENTVNNVPNFEHDQLFSKEKKAKESIEDLKSVGISLGQKKEKLLWQNGYIVVENIALLENFLGISITHKSEYSLYNLYDYIYDKEILDFLEKYHSYLHDPAFSSIEEFYKKTKMKVRIVVSDKYRAFTFDRYGITGTDCFGRQTYIYGDYLKDMIGNWEEYQRKEEDYDLCVIFEVEHIDYDEEGIYYQDVYDKWDPLYEDAMEEDEKEKFTNEESEKNYLFRKKRKNV